jgi:hypothetical protein
MEGITSQNSHVLRRDKAEEDSGHNDPASTVGINKWSGHGLEALELGMVKLVKVPPHELLEMPAPVRNEVFVSNVTSFTESRSRKLVSVGSVPTELKGPVPHGGLPPPSIASMLGAQQAPVFREDPPSTPRDPAPMPPVPSPGRRRTTIVLSDDEDDAPLRQTSLPFDSASKPGSGSGSGGDGGDSGNSGGGGGGSGGGGGGGGGGRGGGGGSGGGGGGG